MLQDEWTPSLSNQVARANELKRKNAANKFPAEELKRGNEAEQVLEEIESPDLIAKREELLQRLNNILEVNR